MTAPPDPEPQASDIPFVVGSRRIASVRRRLVPASFTLEDILERRAAPLDAVPACADGLRVMSAPVDRLDSIREKFAGYVIGGFAEYPRHFIRMDGSFEDYLAGFSGKTRSTLRRKQRKLEQELGGTLDIREYTEPDGIERFFDIAVPLSRRTYQARLLDAGLPESGSARRKMAEKAAAGDLRCYLLFAGEHPIAYLSLPVENRTLVYAHLGYDPDWARLSPGTVLQMVALERLFAENRFRYFDFTEGDGAHKAMFGNDSVRCASFYLLRPSLANRSLLWSLTAFDNAVAATKATAERLGALSAARRILRA